MRSFSDLEQDELLALAVALGEEHARIYAEYAHGLRDETPALARAFADMSEEEHAHRRALIDLYQKTHGEHIHLVRPQDVRGFTRHDAIRWKGTIDVEQVLAQAQMVAREARHFYEAARNRTTDVGVRKLLGDLVASEDRHLEQMHGAVANARPVETQADSTKRAFVLQYIQPGLNGLIDGSISSLAPIFAVAFATYDTWTTFLVGLATSVGAGISMGIAEAMSDDGQISGRGHPWRRGTVTGVMTAVGGLGHTLPYLIPDFWTATAIAAVIVVIELWIIAWVRARYMDTPFVRSALEVVAGGMIVFSVGIAIGSA